MKRKDSKKYLKKLGLENASHTLIRLQTNKTVSFDSENELSCFASETVYTILNTFFANDDCRVTLYILRADGTAQFCFHDENGIHPTPKLPLYVVKEHANLFTRDNYYVLMVETKENCFSLVS